MSDLTVATKLVCNDSRKGISFAILLGDNHQFYAVRSNIPYFCFEADTLRGATDAASRAIEFYWNQENDGEKPSALGIAK